MEWFRDIIAAGVPCGPINTVDGGVAFAEEVGLDPVVNVGEGRPPCRRCATRSRFSDTPADYRLPPPSLDEHGEEIRRWLATPAASDGPATPAVGRPTPDRSAATAPRRAFPTSLGTSTADEIRLLGQDLTADLMGKVGFGELAFWLVALRRPTPRRPACSRPSWWRWPTTASPPPRSPPG